MRHAFKRAFLGLLLLTLSSGCPETPPSTERDLGADMPADMADMPSIEDMPADMTPEVDMEQAPPGCNSSDDCTGRWSNWECVDGVCTDCDPGDPGCLCRLNGTCQMGSRCDDAQGLCVPCASGQRDCACDVGDTCGDDLVCEGGVCVEDLCAPGEVDCPCDTGGTCSGDALYCDPLGICRACTSDVEGCACEADGACLGADLYCDEGACAACPEEDRPVQCACASQLDCAIGLTCDDQTMSCREAKTCAELCMPFQLCDESGAGDPVCLMGQCQMGYTFDGMMCVPEAAIESCDGAGGSVDKTPECLMQNKKCVDPADGPAVCVETCSALGATCLTQNRACDAEVGAQDAQCGACLPGYVDDGAGSCAPDQAATCDPAPAPGSILDDCLARQQACEVDLDGAKCGACLQGYTFSASIGACVPDLPCGGQLCALGEYCSYPQAGGPPTCQARTCGAGEALDETSGQCTSCGNLTCDAEGVYPITIDGACACASEVFCSYQYDGAGPRCIKAPCPAGQAETPGGQCTSCPAQCDGSGGRGTRAWPTTTVDGTCFCETQEGYYFPFGGASLPKRCDEDEDGWVNRTALSTFETASNVNMGQIQRDDAVLANFRCELREIDRATLRNEWGQRRHISLCGDALVDYAPGQQPPCSGLGPLKILRLFEPDVLDDDTRVGTDPASFPMYGGRRLEAPELNPLTKACVSQAADFNLNNVEDIREEHALEKTRIPGLVFAGDTADDEFFFHSLAYFVELHQGFYIPPVNAALPGEYLIAERSRCDQDFALTYSSGTGYWRQCTRDRRGDYDRSGAQIGFDFASYHCDGANGSCGVGTPPADASLDDLDGDSVPDHGLCQRADPMPDEPWRGMTHHSQFQCVVLKNAPDSSKPYELAVADVFDSSEVDPTLYEFNACGAIDCSMGGAGCEETISQGTSQPRVTQLECNIRERAQAAQDQVGFTSLRYTPEGSAVSLTRPYVRGCIDESFGNDGLNAWSALCPGYTLDYPVNDDTCATSQNGLCEDGGQGALAAVCPTGTDLTDCGMRFQDNSQAVLTAGNPGDYGKLICSCNRFFAGPNCEVSCTERQTHNFGSPTSYLHVGDRERGYSFEEYASYACSPADRYCSLHPPVPAEGFGGGRRGYWVCAETSLTRTVDDMGQDVPGLIGGGLVDGMSRNYSASGKVRVAPVQRALLEDSTCTSGCYSAF